MTMTHTTDGRPRARGLGIVLPGEPGPLNAITDVGGVEVGVTTLIGGDGPLVVGTGPVRTGVTASLPRGRDGVGQPCAAGWYSLNGNGEMTGTTWIEETVRRLTVAADPATTDTRAFGWDTRSPRGYTVAGTSFGPRSFGHTGDTGTSIWVDPEADVFVVLLSNRTFPTRHNREHVHERPVVSDHAWRAVLGPLPVRAPDAADAAR